MSKASVPLENLRASPPALPPWRLETFFGCLAEFSGEAGTAVLSLAFRLVLEAQRLGEPVVWITDGKTSFFPPDAARGGIDLETLVVVRVATVDLMPRAADLLVRSGGFGLIVMDLGRTTHLPIAMQTRLAGLAKKHHSALLVLTEKSDDAPSLGALVSLRATVTRTEKVGERFRCETRALKDKRHGIGWSQGWSHIEVSRAPDGLR